MKSRINWVEFKRKNKDCETAFQELCLHLFCREFGIGSTRDGIHANFNNIGLETHPIEYDGNLYGFQAKFFESETKYRKVEDSVTKALRKYPNEEGYPKKLDTIYVYLKKDPTESKKEKEIVELAAKNKVKVFFKGDSWFKERLFRPQNIELAQIYFGIGDEFGFINNSINSDQITFLNSKEYLVLPFQDKLNNNSNISLSDITNKILDCSANTERKNIFLLTGHAGSGKSLCILKLFQQLGGLDQDTEELMREFWVKNKALPMRVELRDCRDDSLENLVRERQKDYGVRKYDFLYLFDGLDELDREKAESALIYISKLNDSKNTKGIVISCRTSNSNLTSLKSQPHSYDILEYSIDNLKKEHIYKYFKNKNNNEKEKALTKLEEANSEELEKINDIFIINLLWDTIEEFKEKGDILDLFSIKIDKLLNKNIESLNLLDPKKEKIIDLNQEIALELHKKFQFRFSLADLQRIVINKYPTMDFNSVNKILDYVISNFFDNYSNQDSINSNYAYAYLHRRYQEYFLAQKLADEYKNSAEVLRDYRVLSDLTFFENLFLPYLRKQYTKTENLPGIIELNLIDIYLGNSNSFIPDDPYYMESPAFIKALALQDEAFFSELLENENLALRDKIFIKQTAKENLKKRFGELESTLSKEELTNRLINVTDELLNDWNDECLFLLKNMVIFRKSGKIKLVDELKVNFYEVRDFKNEYPSVFKKLDKIINNGFSVAEDYLYMCIVIEDKDPCEIFNKIRQNSVSDREDNASKTLGIFFNTCIKYKTDFLCAKIETLNEKELSYLAEEFIKEENLRFLVQNETIAKELKKKIEGLESNYISILFCKKIFDIDITEKEKNHLRGELESVLRLNDPYRHKKYSLISYCLNEYIYGESISEQLKVSDTLKNYVELDLYSLLFRDYIELLKGKKNINTIVRGYCEYINFHTNKRDDNLKYIISLLLARIVGLEEDYNNLLNIKNIIIRNENNENKNIDLLLFYSTLQDLLQEMFGKIVNENDLQCLEGELDSWDKDFHSYIEQCFTLASLFAKIDKQKVIKYFYMGINYGILRHGWHKDTIISGGLIDALEVLWKNNWTSNKELIDFTNEVFNLTIRLKKITDGDHTWWASQKVVHLAAKYNIELAIALKDTLKNSSLNIYEINKAITSVIIGKINLCFPMEKIEGEMGEYVMNYRYDGKDNPDSYEQKFLVYLSITKNDFYTHREQYEAFEKAYKLVEEMKRCCSEYLKSEEFNDSKKIYEQLCNKYEKPLNIKSDANNSEKIENTEEIDIFFGELNQAETEREILNLYKKLSNDDNKVELKNQETWKLLIEKTYFLTGNITPFVKWLEEKKYPFYTWRSYNSEYFHFGVAEAISNYNTKKEIMDYLFDTHTGYHGFAALMKTYTVIGNREMCMKLFKRYLRFCIFLTV